MVCSLCRCLDPSACDQEKDEGDQGEFEGSGSENMDEGQGRTGRKIGQWSNILGSIRRRWERIYLYPLSCISSNQVKMSETSSQLLPPAPPGIDLASSAGASEAMHIGYRPLPLRCCSRRVHVADAQLFPPGDRPRGDHICEILTLIKRAWSTCRYWSRGRSRQRGSSGHSHG